MESTRNHLELTRERQLHILAKLTEAEVWETFVDKAYPKKKRFSLEGGERAPVTIRGTIRTDYDLGRRSLTLGRRSLTPRPTR